MIAGSILKLEIHNISSESLRYFLNSYGCHIQDTNTFNYMLINHSSIIQFFINKNIQYEFKRYTDINNKVEFLEHQGNIEIIENATQQQINNISTNYINSKYSKKKRKTFFSKKKKRNYFIYYRQKNIKLFKIQNFTKIKDSRAYIFTYIGRTFHFFSPEPNQKTFIQFTRKFNLYKGYDKFGLLSITCNNIWTV